MIIVHARRDGARQVSAYEIWRHEPRCARVAAPLFLCVTHGNTPHSCSKAASRGIPLAAALVGFMRIQWHPPIRNATQRLLQQFA